jgi:hypothetical protein
MHKPRLKKHYNSLPPPPRFPAWCAYEAVAIAGHLKRNHNAKSWQLDYLLGMLDGRYIVSLPRLKRDKTELCNRSPQHLRWLWVSWAAKLLGWKDSRPEGHPDGFSAEVYTDLKAKVFPFPKVERDEKGLKVVAAVVTWDSSVGSSTFHYSVHCPLQSGRSGQSTQRCSHRGGRSTLHIGSSSRVPALEPRGQIADTTSSR